MKQDFPAARDAFRQSLEALLAAIMTPPSNEEAALAAMDDIAPKVTALAKHWTNADPTAGYVWFDVFSFGNTATGPQQTFPSKTSGRFEVGTTRDGFEVIGHGIDDAKRTGTNYWWRGMDAVAPAARDLGGKPAAPPLGTVKRDDPVNPVLGYPPPPALPIVR